MRHENNERAVYKLGKYPQCKRTFYSQADGLPADSITQLAVSQDGTVWAGTESGLARLEGERWVIQSSGNLPSAGRVEFLYADHTGKVWATIGGGLYQWVSGIWHKDRSNLAALAMCEDGNGTLWMAAESQLYKLSGSGWSRVARLPHAEVRAMAAFGDSRVYVATDAGLFGLDGKRPHWFHIMKSQNGLFSSDLRGLFADPWGHLWIGTDKGVCIYDDHNYFYRLDGSKGLPYEDVTAVAAGIDGERWFGTSRGLVRLKDGQWKYYASRRWLPDDDVRAIAVGLDGAVWVGTASGVGKLEMKLMTLEQKADVYDQTVDQYHKRHHYVTIRDLSEPHQLQSGKVEISDNDGLWTAAYVAAQSYRYAVTGDPQAKERAQQSVHAMMNLLDITGREGFFARAMCHRSEAEFGTIGPRHEWHLSADGEWEWKGDTSSDETTGHYYAYAVYYDLVADEEDKKRLSATVRAITDHILEHDFCLTDLDGRRTTWAVWTPEKLNHDAKWVEQTGINSQQMLMFLKVTYHITKDEKYEQMYQELIRHHRYAMNTIAPKFTFLGKEASIDDNLGFHTYIPLLVYETDPHIRGFFMMGLEQHWQYERPERSPFWNAVYGALTRRVCDIEAAVQSLAEMPLDLIHYRVENSHRADIQFDPEYEAYGYQVLTKPLPFDERPLHKWDKTPYLADGGNGMRAEDGTLFLHPYWLARYWKLIEEAD